MKRLILSLSFLMLLGSFVQAKIIYVNASAAGSNNGTDWVNAYTEIDSLYGNISTNDSIFVAAGIYKPRSSQKQFLFNVSVNMYGGFPNTGNPGWAQRDWVVNQSICDGDINGDDGSNMFTDNAKRVFRCNLSCTIDGFVIRNGGNNTSQNGAAIMFNNKKGRIANCTFENNRVLNASLQLWGAGGAIHVPRASASETDTLYIENCFFKKNVANVGGAINSEQCTLIKNCKFSENLASNGAAIGMMADYNDANDDIALVLNQCVFYKNGTANQKTPIYLLTTRSGADGSTIYFKSDFCTYYKEYGILKPVLNNPSSNFNFMTFECSNNIIVVDSASHGFNQTADIFTEDLNQPHWYNQITVNNAGRNMINYAGVNPNFEVHIPNWATIDTANLEFVLACTSWGVDSASTTANTTDIAGNPRVDGSSADLGAFESQCNTSPNAVSDISQHAQLRIYPNPTTGKLNIDMHKQTIKNIEVYNITGKKLKTFQPNQPLDVSSLPSGLYILRVATDNGMVHSRFVKE